MLESKRGTSTKNWKDSDKYLWRPDIRPRMNDWISDFTLAGQAALDGPEWASRMVMFRLYYLGLTPFDRARHFLGLSEHSWVNWPGRDSATLRERTAAPPNVPTKEIFYERWLDRSVQYSRLEGLEARR